MDGEPAVFVGVAADDAYGGVVFAAVVAFDGQALVPPGDVFVGFAVFGFGVGRCGGQDAFSDGSYVFWGEFGVEAGDGFAEHAGDFEGVVSLAEVLVGELAVDVVLASGVRGDLCALEGLPAEFAEDFECEAFPFRFVDECHGAVPLLGVSYSVPSLCRGNGWEKYGNDNGAYQMLP